MTILTALGVVASGCTRQGGGDEEVGSVRGDGAELVVTWHAPAARMFLRTSTGTSLVLPLVVKADVDQALRVIESGGRASPPDPSSGEVVLARMNTGRPEAREANSAGRLSTE